MNDNKPESSAQLPPDLAALIPQEIAGITLSMRIPPFWRDKPRLWFISFEAATSEMKKGQAQLAQLVIAKLEKQDIEQVADLLHNPPATEQYTTLKNRLISAYEESDSRQLQKLLSEIELGDQKPTQLLRRMRSLARDKVPDPTLRMMWTNHLPPHVRSVLAVSESFSTQTALDELALLADKMMETSAGTQISVVGKSSELTVTVTPHSAGQYWCRGSIEGRHNVETPAVIYLRVESNRVELS
ncbi:Uncharacterized protein OBRU01_06312 [Operophtera brumata]|uniref:DUF7041 domain-containing protein n=1 Tax=Operophtera brumata TaxID=104452 RepID=A0A0L7LKK8_OPEBR|nr:Uncharacterized protein OBRU01_06312 [Operophtera brumata]